MSTKYPLIGLRKDQYSAASRVTREGILPATLALRCVYDIYRYRQALIQGPFMTIKHYRKQRGG